MTRNLDHFEDLVIVPAGESCLTTHPYEDGWRIIRSIHPEHEHPRLLMGKLGRWYRGYTIRFDPPPIPYRGADWDFYHKDYDGADDSNDNRCGTAATLDACFDEIDMIEDDQ